MPGGLQGDFRISFGFEPWHELLKVDFKKDPVASDQV